MKILLYDNGLTFGQLTPYTEPLGGSEISILLLAKGLADLGHQVVLLANTYKEESNFILDNINLFDQYANISDIIIFNRIIPPNVMKHLNKKLFYLSHDAYDQQNIKWMMNKGATDYLNKIICVSNWQKNTFIKYLKVPENKLEVLGNPIDYSLYYGYTKRDNNKLIFSSIPFKGLEVLPIIFNKLKLLNSKVTLDIYSSFEMYKRSEEDKSYDTVYRELDNIEGVTLYKSISMKELAYKFKAASLYIAPSIYHETFGRVFVEAMAGGCLPVVLNNGANKEIIGDNGFILDYPNINNSNTLEYYVEFINNILKKDQYNKRVLAEQTMKCWDKISVSKNLLEIVGENHDNNTC